MKYYNLNSTLLFCAAIKYEDDEADSLLGLLDTLTAKKDNNGNLYIDSFTVLVNITVLLKELKSSTNYMQYDTDYQFRVRIISDSKGLGKNLCDFNISINKDELRGKEYCEYKCSLVVKNLYIQPGAGAYTVQLLAKKEKQEHWRIQTEHALSIIEQ